jgi:hypothetical protein
MKGQFYANIVEFQICRRADQNRQLFLFSDMIIYARLTYSLNIKEGVLTNFRKLQYEWCRMIPNVIGNDAMYIFNRKIHLDRLRVVDTPDNEGTHDSFSCFSLLITFFRIDIINSFQIISPEKSFSVYTGNKRDFIICDLLKNNYMIV